MFSVNDWQNIFENLSFSSTVTRSAGYAINFGANVSCFVTGCQFNSMFNGVLMNGTICGVQNCQFTNTVNFSIQFNGSVVNSFVDLCTFDCSPASVAHIEVNQCGSLLISNCDIIHAVNNLRINPTSPNGCFSIYCVNVFFDTATGSSVKFMGTGNIQRAQFTQCWFSGSTNGCEFASTAVTLPTGIDFVNCDIFSNTANGILATAVQDFSVNAGCRIAGNVTAGVNISASAGAVTKFNILNSVISPTGGIGGNGTGVLINAGTYGAGIISLNNVSNNITANVTNNGIVTGQNQFIIKDNIGDILSGGLSSTTAAVTVVANANTIVAGGLNICPIPSNSLNIGTSFRVTIMGSFTGTATATAIQVHLGTAGTVADAVILTASVTGAVGTSQGKIVIDFTFRTIGAAGTVFGAILLTQASALGLGNAAVLPVVCTTTTAPNTTTANYITVSLLSAAAGSSGTTQNGIIEVVKP
jgi:hypothetical protein